MFPNISIIFLSQRSIAPLPFSKFSCSAIRSTSWDLSGWQPFTQWWFYGFPWFQYFTSYSRILLGRIGKSCLNDCYPICFPFVEPYMIIGYHHYWTLVYWSSFICGRGLAEKEQVCFFSYLESTCCFWWSISYTVIILD